MDQRSRMTVRPFKITDKEWLVDQLELFADFYGTEKSFFLDRANTRLLVQNLADNHVLFIAEKDHVLHGFIAGYYNIHPYNPKITMLTEAFWWVTVAKRNTRAATLLLNKFIEFGEKHADMITLTLEENSPMSDKHFKKRGFKLKEKNYVMECK